MIEFSQEITVRIPSHQVSGKVHVDAFNLVPMSEQTSAGTVWTIDLDLYADTLPAVLQFGYPVYACVDFADTEGNTYTVGSTLMPARLTCTRLLNRWRLHLDAVLLQPLF